jgi:hypothetical protein
MFSLGQIANRKSRQYATGSDFCRIFGENMNGLYLLSFLLTADESTAEKCFVRGLEDTVKGNPVFKEWAHSWARRTIIRNAIQLVRPQAADVDVANPAVPGSQFIAEHAELAALVELPAFERFVFVMSVLEHYSDQECSLLLECARGDVIRARSTAQQKIADSDQAGRNLISFIERKPALLENPGTLHTIKARLQLATSA